MVDESDTAINEALDLFEQSSDSQLNVNVKKKQKISSILLPMFIIMQQYEETLTMPIKITDEFRMSGDYK